MIDYINRTMRKHIITLEDPIEYLHRHKLSIINQREIGFDTTDFATGLRASLRQDPDVILVGEMRDLETISTAITAAETGHLVFATLHTPDAPQTIDRIIDVFPSGQQPQMRIQLASVLLSVISQRLFPKIGGGRIAATEILINTPAVGNLIRMEKVHQIRSVMQTGRELGMHTLEMSIQDLISRGMIMKETAQNYIGEKVLG
jgi:twitching motility protein PilT